MKWHLVDASAFITLAAVDALELLERTTGEVIVPRAVADEVTNHPVASALEDGIDEGWIHVERADEIDADH